MDSHRLRSIRSRPSGEGAGWPWEAATSASRTLRPQLPALPSSSQDPRGAQCPAREEPSVQPSFQGADPLGPFRPFVYSFDSLYWASATYLSRS